MLTAVFSQVQAVLPEGESEVKSLYHTPPCTTMHHTHCYSFSCSCHPLTCHDVRCCTVGQPRDPLCRCAKERQEGRRMSSSRTTLRQTPLKKELCLAGRVNFV